MCKIFFAHQKNIAPRVLQILFIIKKLLLWPCLSDSNMKVTSCSWEERTVDSSFGVGKEKWKCWFLSCVWLFVTPWIVARPPVSSVQGILQARTQEWLAIPFSRGSSQPRNRTCVFCTAELLLTVLANWEEVGTDDGSKAGPIGKEIS